MTRTKYVLGSVAGAAFIHLAFLACSTVSPARDASADVPVSFDAIMDAIRDVELPEASADAGVPLGATAVPCNLTRVETQVNGSTTFEYTSWWAELPVTGLDPRTAPVISVALCDQEAFTPETCPAGSTCTSSGYTPASNYCSVSGARVLPGKVVVWCGQRVQVTSGGGTSVSGSRFVNAYVRVQ